MVICFTGTDNSRFIAGAVADALGDEVFRANEAMRTGDARAFDSDKPYVFVFPVYLSIMPERFRQFIEGCTFSGRREAYFIPTCAGADGSVPNAAEALCERTGALIYKGSRKIIMPQNYIVFFRPTPEEEKRRRYAEARTAVREICDTIRAGGTLTEKKASGFEYACTKWVEGWYNRRFAVTKPFRAGESCVGCGLCARGCPAGAIVMREGRPVWEKKTCMHCMACISRCPKQAIEFGRLTKGKTRHICPEYKP